MKPPQSVQKIWCQQVSPIHFQSLKEKNPNIVAKSDQKYLIPKYLLHRRSTVCTFVYTVYGLFSRENLCILQLK